jgi:hypothetical protein
MFNKNTKQYEKMLFAFYGMIPESKLKKQKRYINSKLYESVRKNFSDMMSKKMKNTVTCKSLSNPEMGYFRVSKEEFDSNDDLVGMTYGNKLTFTEEHKRKIGDANKGKKVSKETRQKMSESRKGFRYTEEQKKEFSKQRKGKIWIHKIIDGKYITKMIWPSEIDMYLKEGFIKGRGENGK